MFDSLADALRRYKRRAYERNVPRLETDEHGFTIVRRRRAPVTLCWDEIRELVAWKHDAFTIDLLCISVDCPARGGEYVVHEEMPGYDVWQATMERIFSVDHSWWSEVVFPAFAPNVTLIYRRCDNPSATREADQP